MALCSRLPYARVSGDSRRAAALARRSRKAGNSNQLDLIACIMIVGLTKSGLRPLASAALREHRVGLSPVETVNHYLHPSTVQQIALAART